MKLAEIEKQLVWKRVQCSRDGNFQEASFTHEEVEVEIHRLRQRSKDKWRYSIANVEKEQNTRRYWDAERSMCLNVYSFSNDAEMSLKDCIRGGLYLAKQIAKIDLMKAIPTIIEDDDDEED